MPSGGDLIEITCNHPLGNFTLRPKGNEDSTLDPGGIRTADDENMVDGAGEAIYQMTRRRWSFECPPIGWDMVNGTMDNVIKVAGSPLEGTWTFTYINNVVYRGKGKPVGDIKGNGNQATFGLKIGGSGTLDKL